MHLHSGQQPPRLCSETRRHTTTNNHTNQRSHTEVDETLSFLVKVIGNVAMRQKLASMKLWRTPRTAFSLRSS